MRSHAGRVLVIVGAQVGSQPESARTARTCAFAAPPMFMLGVLTPFVAELVFQCANVHVTHMFE